MEGLPAPVSWGEFLRAERQAGRVSTLPGAPYWQPMHGGSSRPPGGPSLPASTLLVRGQPSRCAPKQLRAAGSQAQTPVSRPQSHHTFCLARNVRTEWNSASVRGVCVCVCV